MRPGEIGQLIATDQQATPKTEADLALAEQVLAEVMDPEVPVVSVVDLGIVRKITWRDGHLSVLITPTYSGCPATEVIELSIREALVQAGFVQAEVVQRLDPAWTTDWITQAGREKLKAYGISPPVGSASKRSLTSVAPQVTCPICGSEHTQLVSEFGSTACKALYRCLDCLEPFDYFKCI
ncbi:phenylacetate-CoA oxygenase subunit PaaJ [Marinomonas sp. A79]|uniref:Phenylacetate-CoA oxygenase subunit PaaJ n=1 Tax=Marinomonas vulgaris TaxID=2823372 RepID=A0ABS5HF12_9GAMM|nr:1,2-phenylacetyl-CoA epoxidase subunit PaaD [Marinomonas vulgaris]MBR7889524.1 phenylacetate-CoA oxygenase subunit PaaJ [Marinomonas vulgaris]